MVRTRGCRVRNPSPAVENAEALQQQNVQPVEVVQEEVVGQQEQVVVQPPMQPEEGEEVVTPPIEQEEGEEVVTPPMHREEGEEVVPPPMQAEEVPEPMEVAQAEEMVQQEEVAEEQEVVQQEELVQQDDVVHQEEFVQQEDVVQHEEAVQPENEAPEQPMQPQRFFIQPAHWMSICRIASRCDIQSVLELVEKKLTGWELAWFKNHAQLKHIFHMPRHDNRRVMGMWMLLLRTVETNKKKEAWFVVNGVPMRYSMYEHALLSGLDCREYPEHYERAGSYRLVQRVFKRTRKIDVQDIKKKLETMHGAGEDRIKVALLYLLTTIVKAKAKVRAGYIEPFLLRVVDDLDFCETFPWGRISFLHVIDRIVHLHDNFRGEVLPSYTFPGFILPLEALPFECIPQLGMKFRREAQNCDSTCPRLCKSEFKRLGHKGIPLGDVYAALGETKDIHRLTPTVDELPLLEDLVDEHPDDVIDPRPDSWSEILNSSGKICWENLYQQDVETRVPSSEDESAEDAEDKQDSDHGNVDPDIDGKLDSFKKEVEERMEQRFDELGESMLKAEELKFKFLKEQMKRMIGSLVKSEFRKWAEEQSRKDAFEVGGSSRRREDLEEPQDSGEAEFVDAAEDMQTSQDDEPPLERNPPETVARVRRERRKRRRGNN